MDAPLHRWVVGLGLGANETGPLALGLWLHETIGAELIALHVIQTPTMPGWARDDMHAGATKLMREQLAGVDAATIAQHEIVFATTPEHALVEQAQTRSAGLLIGRRARSDDERIARLGRVARRVLRHLPGPVGVVPPDLTRAQIGAGPLVLALDPAPACAGAIAFAKMLAAASGRELVVAHVFDALGEPISGTLSPADAERSRRVLRQAEEEALTRALADHQIADQRLMTAIGPSADTLLTMADSVRACAIVCGSRRLSLTERIFEGSLGSLLAGVSRCPVFVVPPSEDADARRP